VGRGKSSPWGLFVCLFRHSTTICRPAQHEKRSTSLGRTLSTRAVGGAPCSQDGQRRGLRAILLCRFVSGVGKDKSCAARSPKRRHRRRKVRFELNSRSLCTYHAVQADKHGQRLVTSPWTKSACRHLVDHETRERYAELHNPARSCSGIRIDVKWTDDLEVPAKRETLT
jgi:hypothetical protein